MPLTSEDFTLPSLTEKKNKVSADKDFMQRLREATAKDKEIMKLLNQADQLKESQPEPKAKMELIDGLAHRIDERGPRIVVPSEILTDTIRECHDQKAVGHRGVHYTYQQIKAVFTWKGMNAHIAQYIANCHTCRRGKTPRHAPYGLLKPLAVPSQPWTDITVDLITGLPPTETGNNAIMTVVDRLTKMKHFIACKASEQSTSAQSLARLFFQHVWCQHGLPDTIVSDRGPPVHFFLLESPL